MFPQRNETTGTSGSQWQQTGKTAKSLLPGVGSRSGTEIGFERDWRSCDTEWEWTSWNSCCALRWWWQTGEFQTCKIKYSNHLNTYTQDLNIQWEQLFLVFKFCDHEIRWIIQILQILNHKTYNFWPLFRPPFENRIIWQPDKFGPFLVPDLSGIQIETVGCIFK